MLHERRNPGNNEPHQFLSKEKWKGQAPMDLFVKIYGQEAAERLGLEKIPPDSILLDLYIFGMGKDKR